MTTNTLRKGFANRRSSLTLILMKFGPDASEWWGNALLVEIWRNLDFERGSGPPNF